MRDIVDGNINIGPVTNRAVVLGEVRSIGRDLAQLEATTRDTGRTRDWLRLEPEIVPLTLRFLSVGRVFQINWEANEIGTRTSSFRSPYSAQLLPLIVKALDAAQYLNDPANRPQFEGDESERLGRLRLWQDNYVVGDIDRRIGSKLYETVLGDRNAIVALENVRSAAIGNGKTVGYMLRFPPEAVTLAALPWELLWDDPNPLVFNQGQLSSFVRYLDLPQALPPPADPGTSLRILAVEPKAGVPEAAWRAERAARRNAWGDLERANEIEAEELEQTTSSGLVDRIQSYPPVDIVHFYGRGRYQNGQGALLFDTEEGGETWVTADRLATLLSNTRLVLLHASKSAMFGNEGLLTGVAPALSAAGVSAVVAMQLTISDRAATRFAAVVYHQLAQGLSVQRAVSLDRQALYVEQDQADSASWYVPTLTIRSRTTEPIRLVQQQ
jgi:CHAT domain